MNGTRFIKVLAVALLSGACVMPVSARTSDTPAFGVWLAQWAQHGRQSGNERLPCRNADKSVCNSTLSPSLSALKSAPSRHASKSSRNKRLNLNAKRARRIDVHGYSAMDVAGGAGAFSWTSGGLLLAGSSHGKRLSVEPGADQGGSNVEVGSLSDFLKDTEARPGDDAPVVTDVAAGVGNNAYGALYDFEDEGGAGENQRGFQEISSLTGAQSLLLSAAAVPEPGTALLIFGGLLALGVTKQRSYKRSGLLSGAV